MPQDQNGDGYYEASGTTAVDLEHLDAVATWLEGLSTYVSTNLIGDVAKLCEIIKSNDVAFGTFKSAMTVAGKHDAFRQTVTENYRAVATDLTSAVTATRKIIENYKTVDERNRAAAQDINRLFGESGSTSPTGSTGAPTSPGAGLNG